MDACTIQTNGSANHAVKMEVDQTYTEEEILYHSETSLESLRTKKDDQEEAAEQ